MFYVYVLQNPKGIFYKGSTNDLLKGVNQHNNSNGFPSFTGKKGPWKLVYFEEFKTREEAGAREKFFKSGKGREFLKGHLKK